MNHARQARREAREAAGTRSRKARCPVCHKLRVRWMRANAWGPARTGWAPLVPGGPRACFVCVRNAGSAGA